jgi:hypothetical protein
MSGNHSDLNHSDETLLVPAAPSFNSFCKISFGSQSRRYKTL